MENNRFCSKKGMNSTCTNSVNNVSKNLEMETVESANKSPRLGLMTMRRVKFTAMLNGAEPANSLYQVCGFLLNK